MRRFMKAASKAPIMAHAAATLFVPLAGDIVPVIVDPLEMLAPEIQKPFAALKDSEKGKRTMTEALQQLIDNEREEGREQGREQGAREKTEEFIRNLAAAGLPLEQIVAFANATAEEVHKIIDCAAPVN